MSKGSFRRPQGISNAEWDRRYEETFGPRKQDPGFALHAERNKRIYGDVSHVTRFVLQEGELPEQGQYADENDEVSIPASTETPTSKEDDATGAK